MSQSDDDDPAGNERDDEPIARALSLLADVVNELPATVWMVDASGVFTLSEGGALGSLGLRPGQLVGQSALERYATQPQALAAFQRALRGEGGFQQGEAGGRHFAGRYAPLRDEHGAVQGAVGVALDVTERVTAERALASAEMRFRDLIESAPDGVLLHDGSTVTYANGALASALGYASGDELVGAPTGTIFLIRDRERLQERMRAAREGFTNPPIELELKTAAGPTRWFECSSRGIAYAGSSSFLLHVRDIEERRAMSARLIQTEQLASLGTLAAGVAHEINNPLTYVMMNLELLKRRLAKVVASDDEDARAEMSRELEAATEGVTRVRDIVADLRAFSRQGEGRRTPLDVRSVLDSAVRMAWSEIHHRARLVREYGEIPAVEAPESRLAQVFLNLLVNAAQSFPDGAASAHEIRVVTRTEGDNAVVEVVDDGPGMSEATRARAFEPFYTTKPAGVGTGLGLSICQSIVTSLGGAIAVESPPGGGTVVRVTLPARRGHAPASEPPVSGVSHDTASGRLLIVDDEAEIGESLRKAIGGSWLVEVVTSALDALALFDAGERYDAILCDMMMPDVTGIDLFERARALDPELAELFVFMTGGAFSSDARAFLDATALPRLEKPFSVDELVEELVRARKATAARRRRNGPRDR